MPTWLSFFPLWLLVVVAVWVLIVYIRRLISEARHPADKTSDLVLALPPASAPVGERLARLRVNIAQKFRNSLKENVWSEMFVAIVFGIISPPLPPSLFSGLVRFVFGTLIYFCLFRIMRVLMDAISLYMLPIAVFDCAFCSMPNSIRQGR
jgi:hypothetical protein